MHTTIDGLEMPSHVFLQLWHKTDEMRWVQGILTTDIGAKHHDKEPIDEVGPDSRYIIPHCLSILELITWAQNWAQEQFECGMKACMSGCRNYLVLSSYIECCFSWGMSLPTVLQRLRLLCGRKGSATVCYICYLGWGGFFSKSLLLRGTFILKWVIKAFASCPESVS